MELYYKDLISKEASLEKLVDDLMLVVQGANEFAEAAGANMPRSKREEIRTRLERIKEGCNKIKAQAIASAVATDKLLRKYPYSSVGFAFAIGVLTAVLVRKNRET
jgi:ElaB/YqjD/DUF883 family membrane-anchored ribosome-binding protein